MKENNRNGNFQSNDDHVNKNRNHGGGPRPGQPSGNKDKDEDFPGYPHYPASEDIMNPSNEVERVSVDVENLTPSGSFLNQQLKEKPSGPAGDIPTSTNTGNTDDDLRIVPGTDADLTREEVNLLSSMDDNNSSARLTGEDLDVPGADLDDGAEDIGEEDEENNYYSLGGDRHENLEEDKS